MSNSSSTPRHSALAQDHTFFRSPCSCVRVTFVQYVPLSFFRLRPLAPFVSFPFVVLALEHRTLMTLSNLRPLSRINAHSHPASSLNDKRFAYDAVRSVSGRTFISHFRLLSPHYLPSLHRVYCLCHMDLVSLLNTPSQPSRKAGNRGPFPPSYFSCSSALARPLYDEPSLQCCQSSSGSTDCFAV